MEDFLYCRAKLEAPKIFSFMALKGMFSLAFILDQKHQCRLAEESESCKTDWSHDEFCHISMYCHTAPHSSVECHAHSPCEAG